MRELCVSGARGTMKVNVNSVWYKELNWKAGPKKFILKSGEVEGSGYQTGGPERSTNPPVRAGPLECLFY